MTPFLFPLRSTADLAHAAKTIRASAERGESAAVDLLAKYGLLADTAPHTAMLEALSRESGLVSYEIARKLLPEAEKTTLEFARELADHERELVIVALGRLRMIPEATVNVLDLGVLSPAEARLLAIATAQGFHCSHATSKQIEFCNRERGVVCYVDRTRLPGSTAVIVAPWTDLEQLRAIDGVEAPDAERWYHNSNLRCFPRHHHRGKNQIPYGYSVACLSEGSFARVLIALN